MKLAKDTIKILAPPNELTYDPRLNILKNPNDPEYIIDLYKLDEPYTGSNSVEKVLTRYEARILIRAYRQLEEEITRLTQL